jgi:hypothetical protein
MTIHEDRIREARALRDTSPIVHRIVLTGEDVSAALCVRACQRLGVEGSFTSIQQFKYRPDGELESVEIELVPRAFVEGDPVETIWPLETNAQRLRELAALNEQVTAAILRAEQHPPGTEAATAFREVSRLEEAIARITTPGSLEGGVARRGAVTAALSAGDWLRAMKLANDYLEQAPPLPLEQQLVALIDQAMTAERASRV